MTKLKSPNISNVSCMVKKTTHSQHPFAPLQGVFVSCASPLPINNEGKINNESTAAISGCIVITTVCFNIATLMVTIATPLVKGIVQV
jgi:hypothetical protein